MSPSRLPTFLIIGAMKAGTTTLFDDLAGVPGIAMSSHKEPNTLVRFDRAEDVEADYRTLFAHARESDQRGEASTAYTKRPTHDGVAERARRLLGPELKLIYIRRDPLDRLLSQYRYEAPMGMCGPEGIDTVLRTDPRFVDYSDYDMQEAAWLEHFDAAQLLRLEFADYIADRVGTVKQVCDFLGVPCPADHAIRSGASNASSGRRMQTGLAGRFARSHLYTRHIKPHLPAGLREMLKRLAPKAPDSFESASEETLDWLRQELAARRNETA